MVSAILRLQFVGFRITHSRACIDKCVCARRVWRPIHWSELCRGFVP